MSTPLEIFPAYPKVIPRVSRQRVEDNTGETARFPTLALSPFDVLPELSQARQWGQASPLPSILGQLRSILLGYHHRKRLPIIADGTHGFYEFFVVSSLGRAHSNHFKDLSFTMFKQFDGCRRVGTQVAPNVGLAEIRKLQVRILSDQGDSINLKGKRVYQRWVQRVPSTKIIVHT